MLRLIVVLLTIPVIFVLFIIGLVLFDYIYFPLISSKAEEVAETYLEEKYNEDFVIEESVFSKPLGDDLGRYSIDSHPAKNPKVTVRISVTEDMEPTYDDYVHMKWRAELNEQFGPIYKDLFGSLEEYSYMVNVSFPDEVETNYNITDTYQEIFEKEHKGIGNIIFANVLLNNSNEMDDQLDNVYKLIQYLKNQDLEYFSMRITFFNENLIREISDQDKNLDYNDFNNKHLYSRDYYFEFSYDSRVEESVKSFEGIESPDDLKQYLRK